MDFGPSPGLPPPVVYREEVVLKRFMDYKQLTLGLGISPPISSDSEGYNSISVHE